jgi:hypothetical protein
MKRILTLALVGLAALAVASVAGAQTPPPVVPFPAAQSGAVFVSAQTVTADGALSNYFAPGTSVVFRAYAVDGKTHKIVTTKTSKYFYVKIPTREKNLKLKYTPRAAGASGRYAWTGTWNVPADYATGIVNFKVVVQTKTKRLGSFVQMPVATSQLTISTTPQTPPGSGPASPPAPGASKVNVALYVDSVNGTRPAGAAPRPIGCTQTNVFKRGEQFVLRAWGFDLATGTVLSMDNITDAHFSVAGLPNVTLNWGSHGATGNKVWFWTNFWNIPKDYPLGDVTVHVSFTTTAGKVGTFDYLITIIP